MVPRLLPRFLRQRSATEKARDKLLRMMPKDSVCAEIGVFRGDFTAQILRAVRPRKLHLIDPWRHEPDPAYGDAWYGGKREQAFMDDVLAGVETRFRKELERGRCVIHRLDSAAAARRFDDDSLDWVYIDGNHLYEYVKADLEGFLPKVRTGGYLTGDDYGDGGWWEGGVKRAVDEFVQRPDVELVLLEGTQFVLRRR